MNSYTTSKLFTHKPVINYVSGTTDQKYEPVFTVHEDRIFYLGNNNLLSLSYDSKDWKEEAPPPFNVDYGYTVTSTPAGLVVFGGCLKDDTIIADTWIHSFDRWRALTHNASPRCFHASTWIPSLDALLISGGYNNEGFLGDFLLLDLKSGYTREFPLQYQLSFAFHTITVITNNMLCLYGGKCSDGSQNNKTFLININDGSIREIDVVPFFEPRYLHRAFNFYGNLLVTGGYSEVNSFYLINNTEINKQKSSSLSSKPSNITDHSNANVPLLFVFLHRVWLTFFLPESILSLMPEIGYILSLNKGLMFISPNGSQSAVLYFNESHEPFAGTKDPRYITFLNNLLYQNLNFLNLNPENSPVEVRRKTLLEQRRSLYQEISSKLGVEDLSNLVNERDLLNRLLTKISSTSKFSNSKLNTTSNSNSKPTKTRSNSQVIRNPAMLQIQQPDEFDYSNLKQDAIDNLESLKQLKEQNKETLARTSKTVESLFQEVQLLMTQKGITNSTTISTKNSNEPFSTTIQKASVKNLPVLNTEIERAKLQFKSIVEQLEIYNKMKNDSCRDAINVYERIDILLNERNKKKENLIELQRKYLKNCEEMLSKMTDIYNLSKINENSEKLKKIEKSVLSSYDKLKSLKVDHRTFVNQINYQLTQLKGKINILHNISNFKSREQLLAHAIQTSESLSIISGTFNDYCKQFALPEEKLKLPDISNPMIKMSHLTVLMKHGKRPSFSTDSQIIQDGLWSTFYNIVNNIFVDVDSMDKK